MTSMIFVNLPVKDLNASMAFYEALGFRNNPQFTDDTAACMVWSEAIHVMLLTHDKWRTFTDRPIPPTTSSEVMLAISCSNREAVDAMNNAAARYRTWGSCITEISPTRTGTYGKPCGWTRQRFPEPMTKAREVPVLDGKTRPGTGWPVITWSAMKN